VVAAALSTAPSFEDLLPRLRARIADPARRTDVRPNQLMASIQSLDLAGLVAMSRGINETFAGVLAANREGRVDPAGAALAEDLQRQMTTPVEAPLRPPAPESDLRRVEDELGFALPSALRRTYAEIADGGFGPGEGIASLDAMLAAYRDLRAGEQLPRDRAWPAALLPVVERHPGWDCVDARTGSVIAWDPEDLDERSGEERFRRSFAEAFPSVEAWLADWLGAETVAERTARMMAELMSPESQVRQAREARASIGRMSVEERRKMGLPDVGWERVVWGGIGWEEPDEGGASGA
jgi:SMI1/KNR4 family protein SUKH-1